MSSILTIELLIFGRSFWSHIHYSRFRGLEQKKVEGTMYVTVFSYAQGLLNGSTSSTLGEQMFWRGSSNQEFCYYNPCPAERLDFKVHAGCCNIFKSLSILSVFKQAYWTSIQLCPVVVADLPNLVHISPHVCVCMSVCMSWKGICVWAGIFQPWVLSKLTWSYKLEHAEHFLFWSG